MNKIKILILSDDLGDKDHIKIYNEIYGGGGCYDSIIEFEYVGYEEIVYEKGHDIILIDYGLMGDSSNNVDILRKYYADGTPMFWFGGLSSHYMDACKKDYPKIRFMHQITALDLHNFTTDLDRWLSGIDEIPMSWVTEIPTMNKGGR